MFFANPRPAGEANVMPNLKIERIKQDVKDKTQ